VAKQYREDLARYEVRVYGWDARSVTIELTRSEGRNRRDLVHVWRAVEVPICESIIAEVETVLGADLGCYLRARWGRPDAPAPKLRLFA